MEKVKEQLTLPEIERTRYHIQILTSQSRQLHAELLLTNKLLEEAQLKLISLEGKDKKKEK